MVGPVKNPLHKTVGTFFLSWEEFEEVLLDIENVLNSRLLNYIEAYIEFFILTPTVPMTAQILSLPDDNRELENKYLRKICKYIQTCKKRASLR